MTRNQTNIIKFTKSHYAPTSENEIFSGEWRNLVKSKPFKIKDKNI